MGERSVNRKANFVAGIDPTKGAPGNYVLNQKAPKFGDRRTKRNRDKSSQNRNSIESSRRGE